MRILISNDDGYFAPGIEHLASALRERAQITVVAPERDRSGASNSLTLDRPLFVRRAPNGFLFINGTPTDCVHLAVTGLLDDNPTLARSIRNRFPYLDPLNHLQVELLRRYRGGQTDARTKRAIHLTINGLAAGLRNSG